MNLREALAILSPEDKTLKSVRQAFRSAAKKHHPDHGGNEEMMKLVNLAFETLKNLIDNGVGWLSGDVWEAKRAKPLTETMAEILEAVGHFPGVVCEIVGTWLWVSGDTYPVRKEMKAAGLKWAHKKKVWYFHEGSYRRRHKGSYSMRDIRDLHGATDVSEDPFSKVAA